MQAFQKIEIDNQVAVLFTSDYGIGWSTQVSSEYASMLCMDARIVGPFLKHGKNAAIVAATSLIPNFSIDDSIMSHITLDVRWIQKNTMFTILEHDGREIVKALGPMKCMVA